MSARARARIDHFSQRAIFPGCFPINRTGYPAFRRTCAVSSPNRPSPRTVTHRRPSTAPPRPCGAELLGDLERRRERFDKDGLIVVNRCLARCADLPAGKADQIRERPIVVQNAQHGAVPAMVAEARQAHIAPAADDVDFAGDALANQRFFRRGDDIGDKLMPENAVEIHVPPA